MYTGGKIVLSTILSKFFSQTLSQWFQSVVPQPAASVLPETLWERQIPRLHLRPSESETEGGPQQSEPYQSPQMFLMHAQVWEGLLYLSATANF